MILEGKLNVTFPVGRRAYESLSLLHLCALDKSWAEQWNKGKKIGNFDVRKELAAHPMVESEQEMRELYNFFCSATHPNRELLSRRFLGEGNKFVLGVIGGPNLVLVSDYCIKNLKMWLWLTATVTYFYRETIVEVDRDYIGFMQPISKGSSKGRGVVGRQLQHPFDRGAGLLVEKCCRI